MLPTWLVTTLPIGLIVFVILFAIVAFYFVIKYQDVRKFLAGVFFMTSSILWYLWATRTSIPLVMPQIGFKTIETPDISGQRAVVHFVLFLLCFYFGFIHKPKQQKKT